MNIPTLLGRNGLHVWLGFAQNLVDGSMHLLPEEAGPGGHSGKGRTALQIMSTPENILHMYSIVCAVDICTCAHF